MKVKKDYNIDSTVIEYTDDWYDSLLSFFNEAKELGLDNNTSFEKMKWDIGKWWISIDKNRIVGISGCHPLPEDQTKIWRVMSRSAIIPEYRNRFKNLSRSNINSETTHYHMPLQILWIKKHYPEVEKFVITTNLSNANSVYIRTDHVVHIMETTGIVKKLGVEKIYYTDQTIWEVNVDRLFSIRREFRERLGYDPDDLNID